MKRILILGGGFGGIAVATALRDRLGGNHEIIVVDQQEQFLMGLRKLWALVGLGSLDEGRRSRERLTGGGVQFLRRTIEAIDPARRRVETSEGALEGDYLVVALGAEPRADKVKGFDPHAHNLYDAGSIPALQRAIEGFGGGRIAIVIAGVPYKCPPAPYECAMLLDDHLRGRGLREATEILASTPQPILMPNAGVEGSRWLGEQLTSRGIGFHTGRKVERFEERKVVWSDGELEADLIIGVPPHLPPAVVLESGLTGDGDWIAVDPATLRTAVDGVFAIGDSTQIKLANDLPLPKAGIFAEAEGKHVASSIAAEIAGTPAPPPYDGQGYCFIEMGKQQATMVEGDFFASPEPLIRLREPSTANAEEKRRFESERLTLWFGG
jgi:sulfide:quinone oxidoreductase